MKLFDWRGTQPCSRAAGTIPRFEKIGFCRHHPFFPVPKNPQHAIYLHFNQTSVRNACPLHSNAFPCPFAMVLPIYYTQVRPRIPIPEACHSVLPSIMGEYHTIAPLPTAPLVNRQATSRSHLSAAEKPFIVSRRASRGVFLSFVEIVPMPRQRFCLNRKRTDNDGSCALPGRQCPSPHGSDKDPHLARRLWAIQGPFGRH
ncbi:hypothetical protein B0H16DRAFT_1550927 [Mycena metata]|uniref:Uncharacterized protein n=1 Tax=Mycena metata TaxID=1033252 RepID=A0AAD7IQY2_9AGAR|nr:hypothetical protein B0H16DRAFT_1552755 [Mycena metata]KAJ7749636.1 hypothetical protein B0H16DRAFT_1550927 [Mycena metata]